MEATTLHPYRARNPEELSFGANEEILILSMEDRQWFTGERDGEKGLVPHNYVKLKPHEFFRGNMPRDNAEYILKEPNKQQGEFIVRLAGNNLERFSLSVKCENGVQHFKIHRDDDLQYHVWNDKFRSLNQLIDFHKTRSISRQYNITLKDNSSRQRNPDIDNPSPAPPINSSGPGIRPQNLPGMGVRPPINLPNMGVRPPINLPGMGVRPPINLPGMGTPTSNNVSIVRPANNLTGIGPLPPINSFKPQGTVTTGPTNSIKNTRNMFENPSIANKPSFGGAQASVRNNNYQVKSSGSTIQNSVSKLMAGGTFQPKTRSQSPQAQRKPPTPEPERSPSPEPQSYPKFRALYDYEATDTDEITFYEGEILEIIEKHDNGWCDARIGNREGLAPHNYLEPYND